MQRVGTLMWDSKRALITACLAGFGRGIGEVGAIMIVGGNIDNATRVLTTAISLETSRGDFALALALGFVLISLACHAHTGMCQTSPACFLLACLTQPQINTSAMNLKMPWKDF